MEGHLTDITTDAALAFLSAHRDEAFFLNVWYHTPHRPLEPPPSWAARYADQPGGDYAAMVSHGDAQLGRLLSSLDSLGLSENTIVIVTSDNGAANASKSDDESEPHLRGSKGELYEGGIRVPLIIRWPGRVAAGSHSDRVASGLDFAATFRELLAEPEVTAKSKGSRSLVGPLTGEPDAPADGEERTLFWENKMPGEPMDQGARAAVRQGRWKALFHPGQDRWDLFDLAADPSESHNLALEAPERLAALVGNYEAWRAGIDRVRIEIASVEGTVELQQGEIRLQDGVVRLQPDDRFRVHDGDLSLRLRLRADLLGITQTLVAHPGSWRLDAEADGTLRFVVFDGESDKRLMGIELRSGGRLEVGRAAEVVFTIHGRRSRPSTVRLYLDGQLEAEQKIRNVATSDHALLLGNGLTAESPFRGVLCMPDIRQRSLLRGEIGVGIPEASEHRPCAE